MASLQPCGAPNIEVPVTIATPGSMVTGASGLHLPMGVSPAERVTPLKPSYQTASSVHQTPRSATSARVQHLSSLPQSACSPLLHTPGGTTAASMSRLTPGGNYRTPGSGTGNRFTPRYHTTPGGTSKQIVSNPFERHLMDKLHSDSPMFSPNMFKLVDPGSAEKTPKSFRWSIDQIAILKPAEIDEMPIQQDTLNLVDKVADVKAQKAIEKFFEKGNIVPSPWTEPVKFELPRTPVAENAEVQRHTPVAMETSSKEASCQTLITLPKDFDLQKVLGEQHVYNGVQSVTMDTGDNNADMSTSSLRRKLFFHGDEGLSPVRGNKSRLTEVMDMTSPMVSPVKCGAASASLASSSSSAASASAGVASTPLCQGKLSPIHTPSSGQFSSSPIHGRDSLMTPSMRRCSTAPALIDSPNFSPIGGGEAHAAAHTPPHARLQATPSSGAPSRQFGSPDMSPIAMGGPGGGHGNSYMESPDAGKTYSTSDSLRRRALRGCTDRPPVPRELQMSPIANPFSLGFTKQPVTDDMIPTQQHMDMSFECLEDGAPTRTKEHNQIDAQASRPEFTEFREYYDFDGDNTTGFHVNSHSNNTQSQDTGYQTYSVNQETGLTTTQNLEESQNASAVDSGPTNITGHFSALSSNLGPTSEGQFKSRTTLKPKFPSRVHFDIEEEKEVEEMGSNKTLPFSHYHESFNSSVKSTDDIIAEKPNRLIFSDLENLANKFNGTGSSTSSTFTFSVGQNSTSSLTKTGTSFSTATSSRSICKSFSTGNIEEMQSLPGFLDVDTMKGKNLVNKTNSLPPSSEYEVAEHMRQYTRGSMINHEQVYEPPIYVMTSQGATQQPKYSSPLCCCSTSNSKHLAAGSCHCNPTDIHMTDHFNSLSSSSRIIRSDEGQTMDNSADGRSCKTVQNPLCSTSSTMNNNSSYHYDSNQSHNAQAKPMQRSKSAASALLPLQNHHPHSKQQLQPPLPSGRPAHTNPAFTIETLTPKNTGEPRFSGLFPLSTESRSLGVAPLHPRGLNFAQRLLFPDQHPASPVAKQVEDIRQEEDRQGSTRQFGRNGDMMEDRNHLGQKSKEWPALQEDKTSTDPWYTLGRSCTPKRQSLQRLLRGMERRKQDVATMLPSEVALQVLRKAERDLNKLKQGEELDPSFLDNTSFQDSCIVEDIACGDGDTGEK